MNTLRLGKADAAHRPSDFKLAPLLDHATLPVPPTRFGYDGFVAVNGWGMLGNDEAGDCVWAELAHKQMVYSGGDHRTPTPFTTSSVLSDYSAATGYDPADPSTDQGTVYSEAMSYYRHTGILDANGQRHHAGAYVSLTPGDFDQLVLATYLFEEVSIGISFPESAYTQFDAGQAWDVVPGTPNILGGHAIAGVGRSSQDRIQIVSWSRRFAATRAFIHTFMDEGYAVVSDDQLTGSGRSLRGFDVVTLNAMLADL